MEDDLNNLTPTEGVEDGSQPEDGAVPPTLPGASTWQGEGLGGESGNVQPPAESQPEANLSDKMGAQAGPTSPVDQQASTGQATGGGNPLSVLLQKCKEIIAGRKARKLEKIVEMARHQGKISNADVVKVLRCSSATATRYLVELVGEGKLKRQGPNNDAFYEVM